MNLKAKPKYYFCAVTGCWHLRECAFEWQWKIFPAFVLAQYRGGTGYIPSSSGKNMSIDSLGH